MSKGSQQFVLVRGLEDECIRVMPSSTIKSCSSIYVGAMVEVKWGQGKYYDAEV